jgi:hypothetical protein
VPTWLQCKTHPPMLSRCSRERAASAPVAFVVETAASPASTCATQRVSWPELKTYVVGLAPLGHKQVSTDLPHAVVERKIAVLVSLEIWAASQKRLRLIGASCGCILSNSHVLIVIDRRDSFLGIPPELNYWSSDTVLPTT